ncbi:MAG: hypothetical protein ACOY94_23675 [Bacillota bacterium]
MRGVTGVVLVGVAVWAWTAGWPGWVPVVAAVIAVVSILEAVVAFCPSGNYMSIDQTFRGTTSGTDGGPAQGR